MLSLILAFAAGSAWAQSATFSGTVLDPSGAAIAGAQVTLTNEATGATRTTTTGSDGKFLFAQLAPGKYKVEVVAQGFKTAVQQHLELLVGITSTVDVRLEVGTVTQVVNVESTVAAINTTDASIGTPISGSELGALPVLDMNPAGLLSLQTGVAYIPSAPDRPGGYGGVTDQDGRSGAVNGARSDQVNVTLDGIDVNDPQNGYAFNSVLRVTQESLAEFRTSTTGYDADSGGRSSSAQVQLVTKSGTNALHGSAYYAHRNEAFNANDFFLNRQGIPEPPFRHHLYGTSLGGPVIKNRIFLFGNYERLTESLFSSATRSVPSVAFKDGVFFYPCRDFDSANDLPQFSSNPACNPPAGGFVQGVSGTSYGMDSNQRPCKQSAAGCGPIQAGFYALSPAQIAAIDPVAGVAGWTGPVGPNPAVLAYDQQLPDPNDSGSFDQLNILGYRFGAPINNMYNTAVVRADVHLDRADKHVVFWRGNLMHDTINDAPQFPGQQPRQTILNNNKGFSVGYTALLTNTLVNNFRYGLTRISEKNSGIRNSEFVAQRFIDDLAGFWDANNETYNQTNGRILPQHHFRDDVSWSKGVHAFSFGGEFRRTRNSTFSTENSFHRLTVNPSWTPLGGANLEPGNSECAQPGCFTVPLNGGGSDAFHDGLTELLGPISLVSAYYNFDKTGATSPEGDPVNRTFGVNEYELYAQDKWRIKPTLTLTLGLRWYLSSPPWETNGNQVTPTPSLGDWFTCRQNAMLAGKPTDQTCGLIQTDLGGPANGREGYYDYDYKNFSPRIALAWAPKFKEGLLHSVFGEGKTSVRAGYAIVYDRIGNGLASSFDRIGSFGLSTSIDSFFGGCGIGNEGTQSAGPCVRFSGNGDTAPAKAQSLQPSPPVGFPQTPPTGLLTVTNGLDNRIKTPYAHTIDFSVGRELPGNMTLEVSYIGRLAHRLTLLRDYAMPADLKDPQSGVTAFQAARQLEGYAEQHKNDSFQGLMTIGTIPYWQNIFPAFGPAGINGGCLLFNVFNVSTNADGSPVQPGQCGSDDGLPMGYSPTQVAYDYMIGYHGTAAGPAFGTSTFWQDVDYFASPAYPTCPTGTDIPQIDTNGDGIPDVGDGILDCPSMFFPSQYVNLNTWTTTGYSYYHGLQVTLRKGYSHGLSFVLNYTYSHSLDTSSTPERQDIIGGFGATGGYSGVTINSWNIRQEYANSDFDIRHQFNGYWVAELPFGRAKWIGGNSSNWLNHLIGGWRLSGIVHLNSGPPANVVNGRTWPTSWDLQGNATCAPQGAYPLGLAIGPCPGTQNVKGAVHASGGQPTPNLFANPDQAIGFFRYTATGERGQRNVLRADKYFSTDLSLAKTIKFTERLGMEIHWDVFNVTNSAYFDASGASLSPSRPGTFGDYTQMLGRPRQMQLGVRLSF
jgi:hypothetical protein